MPPEKSQAEKPPNRAVKKIRTVTTVGNLARGWQQWIAEHTDKQAQEPSGWIPDTVEEGPKTTRWSLVPQEESRQKKPNIILPKKETERRETDADKESLNSKIKRKEVAKTVTSKVQERGMDVGILTNKFNNDLSNVDKILFGNTSPTRRRKCTNRVSELTKGWKQVEQEKQEIVSRPPNSRSSSVDTEDSGFGDGNQKCQEESQNLKKEPVITRIKRPCISSEKMKTVTKKYSPVRNMKNRWQNWADEHLVNQKLNPFSEEFDHGLAMATRLHKGDHGYGHPKEGSKTAERAARAEAHVHREIGDLCFIIRTMADVRKDGKVLVTFGELFDRYVRISDKVVGILMRARKHGQVHFEGEMLWQGRDDHVIITLLD
ncbi:actin binding Rho activating protein b [Latimeria chalumnae]|uniref:Actin-binding Rho-activating protein n=1 Tax=Latimeria chalumnae TaxID=7897 RepID=H3B1W6_LATCH|nr:PREDICTED: actin-binding Rho-activating protein [Latimeria chalumnae]|eukprot:XP_006002204.1 PREDICTED: actin-binding Rho-activating protein [Latimeria chalumnae]